MASSGTYNFTITNGEGTLAAYERIGIRAPSLRAEHMVTARREMNLLLVEAANKQVNLWKVEQITVPLLNGVQVYAVPPRVVMMLDVWITTNPGTQQANDRYITPISRTEWASYSQKQTPGPPTTFWFNRLIAPEVTLWPVPSSGGPYALNYFACVQMQDVNLPNGETPDVTYLWLDWFVAGLAHRLARIYAPTLEAIRKTDAIEAWNTAAEQNTENVPFNLALGIGTYYRR